MLTLAECGRNKTACFVSAIGRGAGVPLHTCPEGTVKSGELCYPTCQDGYDGVGPVCWESCPQGLKDAGVFCIHTYGKGCCCTVFGCCGCPEGYKDDGCFCRQSLMKKSYGRGAGVPLGCAPGQEKDGALCYGSCPQGYNGAGPVCWQSQQTSSDFSVRCNEFLWAVDKKTCHQIRTVLDGARVATIACIGVALAATALEALSPLVVAVCSTSVGTATAAVDEIIQLTGAHACPLPPPPCIP